MFDLIAGLPVHALAVHAAVVFVPLLALAAVAYALVPRLRARVGWLAALLALGAPVFALVAMLSGNKLVERKYAGQPAEAVAQVHQHGSFGTYTFWLTLSLGVATGLLVLFTGGPSRRLPKAVEWLLAIVVLGLAGFVAYYVFRTGDSGARNMWGVVA